MTSPALQGWHVVTGTAQTTFNLTSSNYTAFTAGQKLWLSYFYNATRNSGVSTLTITAVCKWYNSSNTLLSTTTGTTVNVNGTVGWTMSPDDPHVAPATAAYGQVTITVTSSVNPVAYDVYVTQVRLGRTQLFATNGATIGPGGNVTGAVDGNGRALIDFTQSHLNNNLDNVGDGSTYGRLPVANSTGTGTSRRALIDFSQGHTNKNTNQLTDGANLGGTAVWTGVSSRPANLSALAGTEGIQNTLISLSSAGALAGAGGGSIAYDSLPDGTTYGKALASRLSAGKPLIDFSEAIHLNKSLANVDGTANTKLGGIAAGATVNNVTYSATAPVSPVNGDIWVDTSVTPNVTRVRVAGAWQVGANYSTNTNQLTDGANLGGTAAWTGVTSVPTALTDGRVAAGLASTGDVARNIPSAIRVSSGIMGHASGATYTGDLAATQNNVTYSSTTPASPVNGDIWVDTSVTPNVTRIRVAGAWQIGANYSTNTNQLTDGANLGGTATWSGVGSRPSNLAALSGSEPIQNTAITLSAAGVLSGAGTSSQINALSILNGPSDVGADLTLVISGSKSVNIACDYLGTPKSGVLPIDAFFTLVSGAGTDVTTSASWSAVATTGSATFTPTSGAPNATGDLNVTAVGASAVVITMTGVYNGKTRTGTLTLNKILDAPPPTSASTASITATSSTTYGTSAIPVLSVAAGATGQVACTFPDDFYKTANGSVDLYGKWQWRVVGGTFADITTEIISDYPCDRLNSTGTNDPGHINCNMTKTGLTNGVAYEFQLLLRVGSTGTVTHVGRATVTGS